MERFTKAPPTATMRLNGSHTLEPNFRARRLRRAVAMAAEGRGGASASGR